MSSNKLTDAEARQLLEMTKKSLVQEINFPTRGNEKEFDELTHYMDEHYSFNITLQTLSTIACMSESKMNHCQPRWR